MPSSSPAPSHTSPSSSPRRVAITGLGAVTPHGLGVARLWAGVVAARSTAARITAFDPTGHRVTFACEVPPLPPDALPRMLLRQADPFARYALLAAEEALTQAGLLVVDDRGDGRRWPLAQAAAVEATRVGVVVGSGVGGIAEMATQQDRLRERGPDRVRPYMSIALPANMAAGQIAIRHGLGGPASAAVAACASGADAIGRGLDLIRLDRADVVVAGGSEAAIVPLTMAGFDAAGAMSRRAEDPSTASRPFDADRDGFVAGEGAGVVVLEAAEHASRRGAAPLAWLDGYGASDDAHDPTQPPPDGEGAVRALLAAMRDARMEPAEVDHVNAHGTSTRLNDAAESAAIRTVFGDPGPPVTSVKGSIGHLLGAAGAVEAVVTVVTLQTGLIPPTANLRTLDDDCRVDVVVTPRRAPVRAAVTSSFGFGGHNVVLALRRAEPDPVTATTRDEIL